MINLQIKSVEYLSITEITNLNKFEEYKYRAIPYTTHVILNETGDIIASGDYEYIIRRKEWIENCCYPCSSVHEIKMEI